MKQSVLVAMACTLVTSSVLAKPIETFGITAVPDAFKDKLMECAYLGDVESKSLWWGVTSSNLGKKGVEKRMYKKANELGATHILIGGTGTDYSGYNKGSAQAFKCSNVNQNDLSDTRSYVDELKGLAELRDESIITEAEFQKQKAEILARE
jgi:hypothetical protein